MSFVDECNLLVAFCLFYCVVCTSCDLKTLFEELKTELCLALLVIFYCNKLVHTHEIFRNLTSNLL